MNYPSLQRLEAAFPGKGQTLRNLLTGLSAPESYECVQALIRQSYHRPKPHDRLMLALNHVLEGHGVECIPASGDTSDWTPDMEYINLGDTYDLTLIYDHLTGSWKLQSWGDWVEIAERRGRHYG